MKLKQPTFRHPAPRRERHSHLRVARAKPEWPDEISAPGCCFSGAEPPHALWLPGVSRLVVAVLALLSSTDALAAISQVQAQNLNPVAGTQDRGAEPTSKPGQSPAAIPWNELGAKAGADYNGDGMGATDAVPPTLSGSVQRSSHTDAVPEGLARSDWASIRAAYEAGRHAFQPVEGQDGVWQARNPGQRWTTKFDRRGFLAQPRGADWQWGLELKAYGFPGAERAVAGMPAVKAEGQRLTYEWDAAVQEWWVNDPRGLEHGFTVKERPLTRPAGTLSPSDGERDGVGGNPLSFILAVRGALTPHVTSDALGVEFRDLDGATVLTYGGLKVWDADGKVLASRFAPSDSRLSTPNSQPTVRLLVEERGARYPLTIDPIAQQAYLKASQVSTSDQFGRSVAVAGDTVVVGAWLEDGSATGVNGPADELAPDAGAAYVFVRSGTTWSQQAYLKASQVSAGDYFGFSAAVSGDTVVVGAFREDGSATGVNGPADEAAYNSGAAYVFTGLVPLPEIAVEHPAGSDLTDGAATVDFGSAMVDCPAARTFIITNSGGANLAGLGITLTGADAGDFTVSPPPAALVPPGGSTTFTVTFTPLTSGPRAAALRLASNDADENPFDIALTGTGQTVLGIAQQAYLKASNTDFLDSFGSAVAISGNTVVVGAWRESSGARGVNGDQADNHATEAGAAYVFVCSGTTLIQQAYLKASNTESFDAGARDGFGSSVAISGDTIVVGAWGEDSSATGVDGTGSDNSATNSGAAYVFTRSGTTWSQQAYLKASNTGGADAIQFGDEFGWSVAASGDTVAVGARQEGSNASGVNGDGSNNSAPSAGAVYVFARSGTAWSQQAYLKASNTRPSLWFGMSVAASGDTVVVGTPQEPSNATGINGNQSDSSASHSGAAYVFTRSGTNWTQQAYLKASNAGVNDGFGISVAVSGDTLVIGAQGEGSNATGLNGNQSDNSATGSGAAYVFVRTGTNWLQQAYLKASNTGMDDLFGDAVAISGGTVLVGAYGEASNATGVNGNQADNSASAAGAAYLFAGFGPPLLEIAVEQPPGAGLIDGSASIEFGSGLVDCDSFSRTFLIRNDGTLALAGLGISVTGPHAGDFTVTALPASLVSGGSTTFTVTFLPRAPGARAATLHLANNDPDENPFDIALTGTGLTVSDLVQQAYLKASNAGANGLFGHAVAVSGNTVVVGATGGSVPGTYVFVRNGATWIEQARLPSVGTSVAISGDTLVVGYPAPGTGSALVYVRDGTNWTLQAGLRASNAGVNDGFGISVTVSGDTLVVGAWKEDSNATGVNGNQNNNSATNSGAAYVFVRTGTNWTQQAYLKASNTGGTPDPFVQSGDQFGRSVALFGDTLVVGADGEDSSATGVNGNQSDNSFPSAGAAYVFVRTGTTWTQQAYLKASNTRPGQFFGPSTAISGDTVLIGSIGERSNATGVNGNQSDDSAAFAGAAYVFVRSGTTWTQQAYLKASNTEFADLFGISVAVSGDTAIVGAYNEDSNATGVNGNQNDNSAPSAGATYLFPGLGVGPRITIRPAPGGGRYIRFQGVPDVSYCLERGLAVTGPFAGIARLTAPVTGLVEFHDATPPPGERFYRVLVGP